MSGISLFLYIDKDDIKKSHNINLILKISNLKKKKDNELN